MANPTIQSLEAQSIDAQSMEAAAIETRSKSRYQTTIANNGCSAIHAAHIGRDVNHAGYHATNDTRRLFCALIVISVFMGIEILGALWSGSLALFADAGHMATDSIALGLALLAGIVARYPPSKRFPYGLKRAQILAAFVNALGLFLLIGFLSFEAVERLFTPQEINTRIMFYTALLGLAANIVAFMILHGGSRGNLNMRGALLHVVGDMLGSVAAILSALIIAVTGFLAIDAVLTLLVCLLIGRSAWMLCRESALILLQGVPPQYDPEEIGGSLRAAMPEIAEITECRLWMLTPECPHLTICLRVGGGDNMNAIRARAKDFLKNHLDIENVICEIEAH